MVELVLEYKSGFMTTKPPTIDEYLEQVAQFVGNDYGKLIRSRFQDHRGSSELAMLATPSPEELTELRRAVAIMTSTEKDNAFALSDDQIQRIAGDAHVDAGSLAIFFNGYTLTYKRVSCPPVKDTDI